METSRFSIAFFIIFLIISDVKGATLRSKEQFQYNDRIDSQESQGLLERLEKELEHHAGKEKRCSIFKAPNLQSTLNLKLRLEEQKRANLCKFCTKLESRKTLEICKKCFDDPLDQDENIILGISEKIKTPSDKNSDETNIKFENKLNKSKENEKNYLKKTNNTQQKINDDIAARNSLGINSNITKSGVSTLITSASSRGSLETFKTQTMNMDDSARKILELKENNSIKHIGKTLSGHSSNSDVDFVRSRTNMNPSTNLQNQNFHHSETGQENLVNRRLKRKKQLRKSEENPDSQILKKQTLLTENSSKIFDVSDETLEDLDDFVELMEEMTTTEPPKKKIPGLKISDLRLRLASLRAKQNKKQPKTEENVKTTTNPTMRMNLADQINDLETLKLENSKNVDDLLEKMKQKPNKLGNEILEENINKKLDEILQILSHNTNKQSMSKEDMKIKLKNILTKNDNLKEENLFSLEEGDLDIPIKNILTTTEKTEDKKSKLIMKLNIPLNNKNYKINQQLTTPQINDASEEITNSESNNSEEIYDDDVDLLDLLQNIEPTAFEPKIISTRSTNTFKHIKPTYFYPTTEKTLIEKENKMLSLHRNKLNELRNKILARRQQNLFEKNLNMKPEIDEEKYKNINLTLINNETKTSTKTLDESELNLEQLLSEHLNPDERLNTELSIPKILRFTENKINLPLILLQNEDGTVEIVLDKAELCTQLNGGKCPLEEKSLCKRKTDENLTKYPLNIFNILKEKANTPSDDKTKEFFYKNIINQKLFELFKSLNVNVENSQELHSYIDDLPDKQKTELKQYLLNSFQNSEKNSNKMDKDLSKKYDATTENSRLYFKIKSEDKITPKKHHFLADVFKNLIHNQIQKELVNTNVCPTCNKNQCFCKNLDKVFFPSEDDSSEYSDSGISRVLDKRQNDKIINEDSDNSSDISPHGTVKRRYKIVHNILDWVHDVMVHNNTIV